MALFQTLQPTVLKEDSSIQKQIDDLKEILPKASKPVQEAIQQDISLLEAGLYGENKILFELKNSHIPMYVLHDLYLKHGDLSAQIDFLVICQRCTYVIECKNLFGNIEINSKGDFIRTIQLGKGYKKEGIYSPITQNTRHLELMRAISLESTAKSLLNKFLGDVFSTTYIPLVVIANEKTVLNDRYAKKEVKNKIIRADQLTAYIKDHEAKSKEPKRSVSEMKASADHWMSCNTENSMDYIEKYRQMEREYRATIKAASIEIAPICPSCGAAMVKRIVKSGPRQGKQIWGCPNYPKCKQIINID